MFVLLVTLVLIFLSAVTAQGSQYNALRFGDSNSDYVSFQYDMSPFRESLTLCTWIKRVSTSSSYPVFFNYWTHTHEILIGADGYFNRVVDDIGLENLRSKFTRPVGTWFSYCISWSLESRTKKVYFDGNLIGADHTDSGRSSVMGGTLWFNRDSVKNGGYSTGSRFGGELFQFNMYSAVLSDSSIKRIADGGLCFDLSEFDGIRALSWDRIFTKSRNGNVREVTVCENLYVAVDKLNQSEARLRRAEERLQAVSVELNETKTELVEVKADLNETEFELLELREELNTTESELETVKSGLEQIEERLESERARHNRTKERLESEKAQHNRTKERLESEKAQHNKTEERLESCSTSLTELEKRAEETRTLQNITRWDVLYTHPYFNQVFTEDHLEKLSSSWDMLSE